MFRLLTRPILPIRRTIANRGGGGLAVARIKCAGRIVANSASNVIESSLSTSSEASDNKEATSATSSTSSSSSSSPSSKTVYHSPLGNIVKKLRFVSVLTGLTGSVGVPCMIMTKSAIPETGMLVSALAFVAMTCGSSVAVHVVFRPYVYTLERIPVRVCHSATTTSSSNSSSIGQPTMLKATTLNLFLQTSETVFDLESVQKYSGLRPLCNFSVRGQYFYVHPEYLYDQQLSHKMELNGGGAKKPAPMTKENPDDFL